MTSLIQAFCTSASGCGHAWTAADQPRSIAIRPDLVEIAVGYTSGDVFFYSAAERRIDRHLGPVTSGADHEVVRLAYSSDGQLFATGDKGGRIAIYDRRSATPRYTARHAALVSGLSFASLPDGEVLLSASWDGRVAVHDFTRHSTLFAPPQPVNISGVRADANQDYNSLTVSPSDGLVIATKNTGSSIWDLGTFPQKQLEAQAFPWPGTKIVWADQRGKMLTDAGLDGTQRVHDRALDSTSQLTRYPSRIIKQAWDPNGVAILSLSANGVIRAYDVIRGRELFSIRLQASLREHEEPRALDMQFACSNAKSEGHECIIATTLGGANRIALLNMPHLP